jgi:hypothetical protein
LFLDGVLCLGELFYDKLGLGVKVVFEKEFRGMAYDEDIMKKLRVFAIPW